MLFPGDLGNHRHFCTFSFCSTSTLKVNHQYFHGRSLYMHVVPQLLWLLPKSWTCRLPESNSQGVYTQSPIGLLKNKAMFKWMQEHSRCPHDYTLGPAQKKKTKLPIPQFLPGRCLPIYFPNCCLRVQLLISLNLDDDYDCLNIDRSWNSTAGSH